MPDDCAVKKAGLFFWAALLAGIPGQHHAAALMSQDMLNSLKVEYSDEAYRRGLAINKLLAQLEGQGIQKQLIEVNRFF